MDRNILLFIYCIVLGLYALYLFFIIDLSAMDVEYSEIQNKTAEIHRQNMQLKNQLLQTGSYLMIDQKARAMGFVPAEIVYLK